MSGDKIVFDSKSGISVEEQREILASINKIAEKNRQSLAHSDVVSATKKGLFFPLAVNIGAVVLLALGSLLLVSFNGRVDAQVRIGNNFYNIAEKALIDEIRKETADRIAAKEIEIASIASRLEEVDNQLLQLSSSHEDLTAEQIAAQQQLLAMQNSYREELSGLQDERSRILEESRSREARLRAEFTAAQQRTATELDSARSELDRLSSEQEKIAAIDSQIAGGLASVSSLVEEGRYEEAAKYIESLRNFNNFNSLSSARSYQSRKDIYNKAIDSMDTIVDEMRKFQGINSEGWELYEANTKMEATITEMQKTIDAFSSGSSGQVRRLNELEETITSLHTNITTLETEKRDLNHTITERDNSIHTLQTTNNTQAQQISTLTDQLDTIRNALQALSQ